MPAGGSHAHLTAGFLRLMLMALFHICFSFKGYYRQSLREHPNDHQLGPPGHQGAGLQLACGTRGLGK